MQSEVKIKKDVCYETPYFGETPFVNWTLNSVKIPNTFYHTTLHRFRVQIGYCWFHSIFRTQRFNTTQSMMHSQDYINSIGCSYFNWNIESKGSKLCGRSVGFLTFISDRGANPSSTLCRVLSKFATVSHNTLFCLLLSSRFREDTQQRFFLKPINGEAETSVCILAYGRTRCGLLC